MSTENVIKVKKRFSKNVVNSAGDVVSYVDKEWARKRGLWEVCNFSNIHPINSRFVEIMESIKRI